METIKTTDNFIHPEGKIQLLNGNVLDCYPLEQPKPAPKNNEHEGKQRELFLHNAFLFLQHRDRIMSDSRMFLCPIPIQSGLAYFGTGGFNRPTLGVYLEWWLSYEGASAIKKNRTKWLVYQMGGSPLSGMNSCGIVNEEGATNSESIYPFSSLWSSFVRINKRYDEAKQLYQAFTLEEVIEILKREGPTTVNDKDIQILFLDSELRRLNKTKTDKIKYLESVIESLKFQLLYDHRDELRAFLAEYNERKEQVARRENEITEECRDLRCRLRLGLIGNKQYQNRISPLKKEKHKNAFKLQDYCIESLDKLFPDLHFSLSDVEHFLEDLGKKQ